MRTITHPACRGLAAALVAALMLLLPDPAHAGWSRPQDTLADNVPIQQLRFTLIDGHGTTYAVWSTDESFAGQNSLQVRTRPAGGGWRPTATLTLPPDTTLEDAAVAPDGTLAVLWSYVVDPDTPYSDSRLVAGTRSPTGRWTTQEFSDLSDGRLATDRRGDFLIDSGMSARFRPAGGQWGPLETVPVGFKVYSGQVQATLDGKGTATFAVVKDTPGFGCSLPLPCRLVTVERRRDGRWSTPAKTPVQVTDPVFAQQSYWLAESATGEAIISWSVQGAVRTTVRPEGTATWGPGHTFGTSADEILPSAVGPHDLASVVWQGTDHHVHVVDHRPDHGWQQRTLGTWTSPQYQEHPEYPSLVAAPDGSTVASWLGTSRMMMATRSSGSAWRPARPVPLGELAVGDHGHVASTWISRQPGNYYTGALVTSGYDPRHARFGSVRTPSAARKGHRLRFSATSASWLQTTIAWRFGDGASAPGRVVHHRYSKAGTYHVRATIKDTSGSSHTVTRTVTIR